MYDFTVVKTNLKDDACTHHPFLNTGEVNGYQKTGKSADL